MKKTIVGLATKDDLQKILDLQKEAFGEVAKMLGVDSVLPMKQTIDEIKEEYQKGIILKCVSDKNTIIGSVRGKENANHDCMVGKLIVSPACQNQGIGKQLMTELETFFPVSNSFELFTSPITPNTVHLYSSLGYKVMDKRLEDGIEIINMRKDRIG